ncbi:MAG: protein YgfX [Candidatus Competibacteraceae bacterium]
MNHQTALNMQLRRSRILLISGSAVHVLSGAAVLVSSIPWWVKAGLIAGIVLSLAWLGYCYGYPRGLRFIARIELLDGRWRLETGAGGVHRGQLIGGYAHPLIVIVNFQLEGGGRRSLTLLPDSADPDDLRRMRVWLRTQRYDDEPEPP